MNRIVRLSACAFLLCALLTFSSRLAARCALQPVCIHDEYSSSWLQLTPNPEDPTQGFVKFSSCTKADQFEGVPAAVREEAPGVFEAVFESPTDQYWIYADIDFNAKTASSTVIDHDRTWVMSDPNTRDSTCGCPSVWITASPATGKRPLVVSFSAYATDPQGSVVLRIWNFGDGARVASGVNVNHLYSRAGKYTVTCTTTNNFGVTASATKAILIK